VCVKNLDVAVEVSNQIAPEALEILTNKPQEVHQEDQEYGVLFFLGPYSPVALGELLSPGPSHVLPTAGSARFFSGLCTKDFLRSTHIISYSKKALEDSRPHIEKLCQIEGLSKHFESVKKRFE
jgi:histidinol dehydrogenase